MPPGFELAPFIAKATTTWGPWIESDIQGAISKMDPEIVKSVIQSGKRPLDDDSMATTAPLTIFYNGMVSVFHVTPLQAEFVMKIGIGEETVDTSSVHHHQLHPLKQQADEEKLVSDESYMDLPIARKKSLQRFLQKRKGRVSLVTE
ncbi:protein TIFY 9-like [Rutidosis leptorrhynchoides]|uniref:protein TIFY 9-like n=1 Tax=Rutidosis leptorrhynchoides TaxID=125765 RepID=UPI003A99DEC3